MGISAKPIGKMQSIMQKISNKKQADEYAIKHAIKPTPVKKETEADV